MLRSAILAITFAALSAGCAGKTLYSGTSGTSLNEEALSREEAEFRHSQVDDIKYSLKFILDSTSPTFSGMIQINFNLKRKSHPLRLDFTKGEVTNMTVNGIRTQPTYNGYAIMVPPTLLNEGQNNIKIDFVHSYGNQGFGLGRFVDPEDQNVYLHTNLEPYRANHVFPCFDQPDLKATYQMEVHAPQTWNVITSVRENSISENGEFRIWNFPESNRFSTYVWSLHAGPYKVWEKSFRIPLRLFVRQSMAKFVKTDEWFSTTQQGFDFYERYFNYPYPFKKYDQIIAPQMGGAMENVAAVTYSESFLSRGEKSNREKQSLADVILHEMAHMWFGNLVTMKWWDDLWLNESFASYMSNLALLNATKYKDANRSFFNSKIGAYWLDESVVTHPIVATIRDTTESMTNFDNITYGKGAAVLKQLEFYLTPEKFQKGVQIYFRRYANQNTRLDDFFAALEEGSGRKLKQWKSDWLQLAGVNTIEPSFSCENGKIKALEILQTATGENSTIRIHRTQISLLTIQEQEIKIEKILPIEILGEKTKVPEAVGLNCPAMVYANYEDYSYAKTLLDSKSLEQFSKDPLAIKDAFLRQMLWETLWNQVQEARLPITSFEKVAVNIGLKEEKDNYILRSLVRTISGPGSSRSLLFYFSRGPSFEFEQRAERIERIIFDRLTKSAPQSEAQKIFFEAFLSSSRTSFSREKMVDFLKGKIQLQGYTLDPDRRWNMLKILAGADHIQARALIDEEEKSDKTYFGKQGALSSRAALPDWPQKQKWIENFKKKNDAYSVDEYWAALGHLFPPSQEKFREQYSADFFNDLLVVNSAQDPATASLFTMLTPIDCGPKSQDRISPFIKAHGNLKPGLIKQLRLQAQENQRCQRIISLVK